MTFCKHDWEEVKSMSLRKIVMDMTNEAHFGSVRYPSLHIDNLYRIRAFDTSTKEFGTTPSLTTHYNQVCLKCGECDDGIGNTQRALDKFYYDAKRARDAKQRRRELARKLWQDNCCTKESE